MGLDDKMTNATEEASGKVKEKTGEATGDRDLQAEGAGEQSKANLKQSGEKVKDAAKGIGDSLKDR
ncbi:CsbD family protein [Arthrobacter sp. R3-55]